MTSDSENVSANNLDTAVNDMAQSYINDDKENDDVENENDSDIEECDTCESECRECFKYENELKLHQLKKCK